MAITINTPSSRRIATLVHLNNLIALALVATLWSSAAAAADASLLRAQITTNHGCLETGGSATFTIGDPITLQLRVSSSVFDTAQDANVLCAQRVCGRVGLFGVERVRRDVIVLREDRVIVVDSEDAILIVILEVKKPEELVFFERPAERTA